MGILYSFFFFNDTATTEIYTLSLHDALPISPFAGGLQIALDLLVDGGIHEHRQNHRRRPIDGHGDRGRGRSEEHTSELQSQSNLVCRLLLEKKKDKYNWNDINKNQCILEAII